MNTIPAKQMMTVEHHCLQLQYAHLRLPQKRVLEKLVTSIEQHGQLVPVVLVPAAENQWVLIDGYLRVNALKRLGRDTVEAEIWQCDTTEALLMILKNHAARALETLEEALFLRELHIHHGLAQHELATRLGRDKSWVSRKLSLLESVPCNVLEALSKGTISMWVATRVLAPLARANSSHAEQLLNYLLKNHHSSRKIQMFFDHYQKSNRPQREKMLDNPGLFIKVQQNIANEKKTADLRNGVEGKWRFQCKQVTSIIKELVTLTPKVIYAEQPQEEREEFLEKFNKAKTQWDLLTETFGRLIDAHQRNAANHYLPLQYGQEQAGDSQNA